jgi:hypothetical protein
VRRRSFLVGGAAALIFRRAFGDTTIDFAPPKKGGASLFLIIPRDEQRDERGRVLGAYLNHASDVELAPLAGVQVACASASQVQKLTGSTGAPPGDPLLALVGADQKVRWASARDLPPRRWDDNGDDSTSVDRQIEFVAARVRELVGAPTGDPKRAASEVRARIVAQAPAGSHWARSASCGFAEVEGMSDPEADSKMSMDCGMGHTPDKSVRFLYWWNQTPARRALERDGR